MSSEERARLALNRRDALRETIKFLQQELVKAEMEVERAYEAVDKEIAK